MNTKPRRGRPPIASLEARAAWQRHRNRRNLQTDLSHLLGIGRSAISQWRWVPAERLETVSKFMGVPPAWLRPDLYPPAPSPDPWSTL